MYNKIIFLCIKWFGLFHWSVSFLFMLFEYLFACCIKNFISTTFHRVMLTRNSHRICILHIWQRGKNKNKYLQICISAIIFFYTLPIMASWLIAILIWNLSILYVHADLWYSSDNSYSNDMVFFRKSIHKCDHAYLLELWGGWWYGSADLILLWQERLRDSVFTLTWLRHIMKSCLAQCLLWPLHLFTVTTLHWVLWKVKLDNSCESNSVGLFLSQTLPSNDIEWHSWHLQDSISNITRA